MENTLIKEDWERVALLETIYLEEELRELEPGKVIVIDLRTETETEKYETNINILPF